MTNSFLAYQFLWLFSCNIYEEREIRIITSMSQQIIIFFKITGNLLKSNN